MKHIINRLASKRISALNREVGKVVGAFELQEGEPLSLGLKFQFNENENGETESIQEQEKYLLSQHDIKFSPSALVTVASLSRKVRFWKAVRALTD